MNALRLYHDLKKRDIRLELVDENLKVDAPVGALTEGDRAALARFKPALLKFLAGAQGRQGHGDDGRRFDASPSRHPGYTSLYDPIEGRWHDFPTRDCYPSVVALVGGRSKGGAA